jgi:ABC-type multidrug transport system ATPase subunit
MPQDASPSPHASLLQSLTYYARLQGRGPDEARREAQSWLSRVGLEGRGQSKLRQLSHGMRRRVSLAQALMGEPELILLDEPLSGLDPELVAQVRALLSERRGRATLVISSHVLAELEELCDYVVFVEAGRCARQGTMASVRRADALIGFRLSQPPDLRRLEAEVEGASFEWSAPELKVAVDSSLPIEQHNARILRSLLDAGVGVLEISLGESLERSYLAGRRPPP